MSTTVDTIRSTSTALKQTLKWFLFNALLSVLLFLVIGILHGVLQVFGVLDDGGQEWPALLIGNPLFFGLTLMGPFILLGTLLYLGILKLSIGSLRRPIARMTALILTPIVLVFDFLVYYRSQTTFEPLNVALLLAYIISYGLLVRLPTRPIIQDAHRES